MLWRIGFCFAVPIAAGNAAPADHSVTVALIGGGFALAVALLTPLVREVLGARAARRDPDELATLRRKVASLEKQLRRRGR